MSVSINQVSATPYIPTAGGVDNTRPEPAGCSTAEAIARAYSLLGEKAYETYSEDFCRDIKTWQSERRTKVKAVYQSAQEERSAAKFRGIFNCVGASLSIASGMMSIGGSCLAARFQNQGNRMQDAPRESLKLGKTMLGDATTREQRASANKLINQSRQEMKDVRMDVDAFHQKGDRMRMIGESGRYVDGAGTGVTKAVGESGATVHDTQRKYADMDGQMSDGNSQLAMETSRRRAGDAGEARKRADEAYQMLVDIARTNARNVIA